MGMNLILVKGSLFEARDKALPDTAFVPAYIQGVFSLEPVVEVPNHGDGLGGRSPDGKIHSFNPVYLNNVRAQFLVEAVVFSGLEEIDIKISK